MGDTVLKLEWSTAGDHRYGMLADICVASVHRNIGDREEWSGTRDGPTRSTWEAAAADAEAEALCDAEHAKVATETGSGGFVGDSRNHLWRVACSVVQALGAVR